MAKKYMVTADKSTAALYFAWEFGIKNAALFAKRQKKGDHIINPITGIVNNRLCKTKREAESLARRIREASAFMQGKLGRTSFGSSVLIIERNNHGNDTFFKHHCGIQDAKSR